MSSSLCESDVNHLVDLLPGFLYKCDLCLSHDRRLFLVKTQCSSLFPSQTELMIAGEVRLGAALVCFSFSLYKEINQCVRGVR